MKKNTINGIAMPIPEAYITRSKEKNRGRLKIYNENSLYLQDSEEFQIELFNPTNNTLLAKIEINGKLISNSGLVIKPAQRVFLERFLDSERKFIFETYAIDNYEEQLKECDNLQSLTQELKLREQLLELTQDITEKEKFLKLILKLKEDIERKTTIVESAKKVKDAVKNNGSIKVHFYNEKIVIPQQIINKINLENWHINSPYKYTTNPYIHNNNIYGNCNTNIGTFTNSNGNNSTLETNINNLSDILRSSTKTFNAVSLDGFLSEDVEDISTKETGRIEQGSVSNQKFETVSIEFEHFIFHTVEYKLLPNSDKPLETKDLRTYCSNCGKKLNPKDNFCPSCGTKC
jgi:hypothetical protein